MQAFAQSRRTPLGLVYGEAATAHPLAEGGADRGRRIAGDASGGDILLHDLTACDRFGLKGRGAGAWLASVGIELPAINSLKRVSDTFDVARLGSEDFVTLSRPDRPSTAVAELRARWEAHAGAPKGFNAWRDEVWAWLHVGGDGVSDFMARTCPVDLHCDRFPLSAVAQTRVAQMDCVVIRTDRTGRTGFDLLFDVASSEFLLRSLEELGA